MRRASPILLALSLPACSARSIRLAPLPPLPAQIADPCPALRPLTDMTLGALVQADSDAAVAYAECQAKQAGAVSAYNAARDAKAK